MRSGKREKFFFALLCILSGGLLLIAVRYSEKLLSRILYREVDLKDSTHVLVLNSDRETKIVPKETDRRGRVFFLNRHLKYTLDDESRYFRVDFFDLDGLKISDILEKYYRTLDQTSWVEK